MIVASDRAALIALARAAAAQHALDPALICAIVEQESAWYPHAIRYEPAFRTRYVAPLGLAPTEEVARSISWGLMQVMGQVAREHGFAAKSLAALCDPSTGLAIGCTVFAAKLRAAVDASYPAGATESDAASVANDEIERALALWNGGANASYAAQVLARLALYQKPRQSCLCQRKNAPQARHTSKIKERVLLFPRLASAPHLATCGTGRIACATHKGSPQ